MNQPLISPEQLQQRLLEKTTSSSSTPVSSFKFLGASQKRSKDKMIPRAIRFDYDKDFVIKDTLLSHVPDRKHFLTHVHKKLASIKTVRLWFTITPNLQLHPCGDVYAQWDTITFTS